MPFKKIRLGQEEIFETKVKDSSGREIENWRCMKSDYFKVVRIMNDKYGLQLSIKTRLPSNELDWME